MESIESLADKGYFEPSDLKKCEENQIVCYVAKPMFCNSTGNSVYFSNKFKYNIYDNTYTCSEKHKLFCMTKKADAIERKYANYEECSKCVNLNHITIILMCHKILSILNSFKYIFKRLFIHFSIYFIFFVF